MKRTILWGVCGLLIALVAFGLYRTFHTPDGLYFATHEFSGCPSRPSCVSSLATDDVHRIEPLRYTGEPGPARHTLEQVIRAMPLTAIEHATPEYLHVVFQTPTAHFHDDVELLVQPGGVIQVRSLSRFGYGDHDANRARVEKLRQAFAQATAAAPPPVVTPAPAPPS